MNSDRRFIPGVSLRQAAAVVGAVFLLLVPTGAVVVNSGVVDFVGQEQQLGLAAADGPNGQYVEFDADNQLKVNISSDGVNPNAVTDFDRVFVVNNTGAGSREVWINHTNSEVLSLYDSDTGESIGFDQRVTLAERERVEVGIRIDTRDPSVTVGEAIEAVLTIHSRTLSAETGPIAELPAAVNFGDVTNGTAATESVTIENAGGAPLSIQGLSITGPDGEAFELTSDEDLPAVIPSGESRSIPVQFAPTREGIHNASLIVTTNQTDTPSTLVGLSGRSVPVEVSVVGGLTVDFGEVATGTAVQRTVAVRNEGSTNVTLVGADLSGSDAGEFAVVNDGFVGPVAPGETVTVPLAYTPSAVGEHDATLRIRTEEAQGSQTTIELTGTGILPANIKLDPTSIDFGEVGKNEHDNRTLTITNDGAEPLELTGASLRGTDADQFGLDAPSLPSTLGPGESTQLTVSFDPTEDGDLTANLRITSDDGDAPVRTVPLAGTSVPAQIGVGDDLDFGEVPVGSSKTLEIPVWNDENSLGDLRVRTTAIVGRNPEAFEVTDGDPPFTLAPGEENVIEVTYSPESTGIKTAQLRIISDGQPSQIDVWMSNTGWRVRVQEVPPSTKGVDSDEESFQFDTGQLKQTSTNVEVDANDLPGDLDMILNVSTPGSRRQNAGVDEVSFRTKENATFDMNFIYDYEPPLPESTTFEPRAEMETLQYITLWHSIDTESFENPSLKFQVRKANLGDDVDPDEVVFSRYADGEWTDYQPTLVRETPNHYVFRISLPGFSEFAVSAPDRQDEESPDETSTPGEGGGGGGDQPGSTPGSGGGTDDEGEVQVEFDDGSGGSGGSEEITITELDTIPGSDSNANPLAVVDQLDGSADGDASARVDSADRGPEFQERVRAAGAGAYTEVGEPIALTGSRSLIRSANGVDGRGQIVRAVDITVPPERKDEPATIQLTVDRARFGSSDPTRAQIGHYTGEGWELLKTDVVSVTDDEVVVEARTPGFSPFAVFANNQVAYTWTLPDGTRTSGREIEPTFDSPGVHDVTLSVSDAFGRSDSVTYGVLANDRPTVEIVVPAEQESDTLVTMRAAVDDEIGNVTVTWQFEDGTEENGTIVTHDFSNGAESVRVVARDEFGATGEVEQTVAPGAFGAPPLLSMAATVPFTVQVLVTFLFALFVTAVASRVFNTGLRVPSTGLWAAVLRRLNGRPPHVTVAENVRVDRDEERFEIGEFGVEDGDGDLRTIELVVRNCRDTVVAKKTIEVEDASVYEAAPETISVLSRVYLVDGGPYEVGIRAEDARGHEATETVTIAQGRV